MRRYFSFMTAAAVVVGLFTAPVAMSAPQFFKGSGDLGNGERIFKNGKGDVPACNSCHGADGTGDEAMGTPGLAGQFYPFLIKQLEDFAKGADQGGRDDTTMFVMNNNARGLTAQDRKDVAYYLSQIKLDVSTEVAKGRQYLKDATANGDQVGLTHLGKSIVEIGSPEISACKSCHGYAGRGAPPVYPIIGLQRYNYLVSQLKKWRDGSRANDPMGQMQEIARRMSDEQIHNAAAYLTQASPYSDGNFFTPYDH